MQKIGEILVTKGYVTQQQLDGVMAVKGDDVQVGQVLIQWGLLTEQQLMEALEIQAPPPPPPPPQPVQPQIPQQPMYQQPPAAQPMAAPDLTMDTLQTSKFKIDLKTMIYIGSLLVSGIAVDPNSSWPPSRGEYKMKDEMSRNKIMTLEKEIEELKEEIKDLEQDLKAK
jgi:hypothetical protein